MAEIRVSAHDMLLVGTVVLFTSLIAQVAAIERMELAFCAPPLSTVNDTIELHSLVVLTRDKAIDKHEYNMKRVPTPQPMITPLVSS